MAKTKAAVAEQDADAPAPAAVAVVVVKPFAGVPDGLIYPRDFVEGDTVEGDLAVVALREGWAERR